MLRSVEWWLSPIEDSIPVPPTAERFLRRAERHARRTGSGIDAAIQVLAQDLSDNELTFLSAEFEQFAYGADMAARDAERARAHAAIGYPSWTTLADEETKLSEGAQHEGEVR
jgi:hypothetical protein